MTKIFWSIPILGVYTYIVTTLVDLGYQTYFNIPAYFLHASITSNISFFFILLWSMWQIFMSFSWWWIIIIPIVGSLVFYFRDHLLRLATVALIIFALSAFNFGTHLAQTRDT